MRFLLLFVIGYTFLILTNRFIGNYSSLIIYTVLLAISARERHITLIPTTLFKALWFAFGVTLVWKLLYPILKDYPVFKAVILSGIYFIVSYFAMKDKLHPQLSMLILVTIPILIFIIDFEAFDLISISYILIGLFSEIALFYLFARIIDKKESQSA